MRSRSLFAFAAAGSLSACGSAPVKQSRAAESPVSVDTILGTPAHDPAPEPPAAPPAFAQCAVCHSAAKGGEVLVGPDLWGVVGTRAASRPGFAYSDQLKAARLDWDAATLDKWLADPVALVPGTRMVFAGQPDPARRRAIIAYLETLR